MIDFHKVVINSANYGMTQKNFHQFCGSKFKDIQSWIDKALKYISGIEAHGSLDILVDVTGCNLCCSLYQASDNI